LNAIGPGNPDYHAFVCHHLLKLRHLGGIPDLALSATRIFNDGVVNEWHETRADGPLLGSTISSSGWFPSSDPLDYASVTYDFGEPVAPLFLYWPRPFGWTTTGVYFSNNGTTWKALGDSLGFGNLVVAVNQSDADAWTSTSVMPERPDASIYPETAPIHPKWFYELLDMDGMFLGTLPVGPPAYPARFEEWHLGAMTPLRQVSARYWRVNRPPATSDFGFQSVRPDGTTSSVNAGFALHMRMVA
jgi:hypothetical protein